MSCLLHKNTKWICKYNNCFLTGFPKTPRNSFASPISFRQTVTYDWLTYSCLCTVNQDRRKYYTSDL